MKKSFSHVDKYRDKRIWKYNGKEWLLETR